jgi:hypothetical protein
MLLTLRIKKHWFDLIANGEKTVEYREDKSFYRKKFEKNKYSYLVLHYQKPIKLLCRIKSIKKTTNPMPELFSTREVFAIEIENPILFWLTLEEFKSRYSQYI